MYKLPKQRYTQEFKQEAVRQVESKGGSPAQVARELGISEQTNARRGREREELGEFKLAEIARHTPHAQISPSPVFHRRRLRKRKRDRPA